MIAALVVFGCASEKPSEPTATTTTVAPTTTNPAGVVTSIDKVDVGACLDNVPQVEQRSVAVIVVPCEDPHSFEVYDQQEYFSEESTAPGVDFPGDTVVSNVAETQCITEFEEFIGVQWEASEYDVQVWWPSETSWIDDDDRLVTCAVYRLNGEPSKGSARGVGG